MCIWIVQCILYVTLRTTVADSGRYKCEATNRFNDSEAYTFTSRSLPVLITVKGLLSVFSVLFQTITKCEKWMGPSCGKTCPYFYYLDRLYLEQVLLVCPSSPQNLLWIRLLLKRTLCSINWHGTKNCLHQTVLEKYFIDPRTNMNLIMLQ